MYKRKKEIDDRANCQPPASAEEARELAAIEAELASFTPGPARLDRDRTMFLAGRASVGAKTTPTVSTRVASTRAASTLAASTLAARRWPIGFAAMTAVAGCLLVVLIVQQQTVIALRATTPTKTNESATAQSPESPGHDSNKSDELQSTPASQEADEWATRSALADDFNRRDSGQRGSGQRGFDFSDERLLTMADSGTLTVRSFIMPDGPRTKTAATAAPTRNWPKQTYKPTPPLPYYKLLRQFQ